MEGARHPVFRCFIIRGLRYGTDFAGAGCGGIRRLVVLGSDFHRRAGIARHFNFSYRQTIFAYPTGGGAYIVAKDNLGTTPSLIAGGSLLVDYILTVAVSSSAGTDAITSAFPVLHDYSVIIALIMIVFLTVMNLRGVTESASVLAIPIYLFIFSIAILIISGGFKFLTGGMHAAAPEFGTSLSHVSIFLPLKAFSSGCSALTGVEAVSNAIPNFKQPAEKMRPEPCR